MGMVTEQVTGSGGGDEVTAEVMGKVKVPGTSPQD